MGGGLTQVCAVIRSLGWRSSGWGGLGPQAPNTGGDPKLGGEPPPRGELQERGRPRQRSLAPVLSFSPGSPKRRPELGCAPDGQTFPCLYPAVQASVSSSYLLTHYFPLLD